MMLFSILLIIITTYIISYDSSEYMMKGSEMEQLEKKAKTLACSFISSDFILSLPNKQKQIIELLKKNKIIKKDSESEETIPNFLSAICYSKIHPQIANEILISVSEGKSDEIIKDKYKYLFEFDPKTDYKNLKKTMKEVKQVMKDIEAEEQSLHEQRNDDPELDNSLKDLQKKMVKNKNYKESKENNEENEKKDKKSKRKKKERKQKEEIKEEKKEEKKEEEKSENKRKRKKNYGLKEFIRRLDLNTIWPFIISLIIILIFPFMLTQTNNIEIENKYKKPKKEEEKLNKNNEIENHKELNNNTDKDIKEKNVKEKIE